MDPKDRFIEAMLSPEGLEACEQLRKECEAKAKATVAQHLGEARPPLPYELRCPFCQADGAGFFVTRFVCASCKTEMDPAEFCEKLHEIILAERCKHAQWNDIIAALSV